MSSLPRLLDSRGIYCRDSRFKTLLAVLLLSPFWLSPEVSHATRADGSTYSTCVLTYVNGVKKWVMRIDPLDVESFQLEISFDPTRAALDTTYGSGGAIFKNPFTGQIKLSGSALSTGRLQLSGTTGQVSAGDVDIFELRFTDLQPGSPIDQVPFTVFATGGDFIGVVDTANAQRSTISPLSIAATTRMATTGVSPLVWDPDGAYDNGGTGGSGTWDIATTRWDNITSFADVPWNNSTNINDVAVFGGNAGTGAVTLSGQISAGGLQFDAPGYTLQSGTLTLAAPSGKVPTIDTGENDASIRSAISGAGFQKTGSGILSLSGSNSYTGPTTINGGTVKLDFTAAGSPLSNILNTLSTLILGGGTFNLTGTAGGTHDQSLSGLTVAVGSSAISVTQNAAANM
ncbi:MAG: fibronectin-binding autotransporter adhesin, partial [Chthoniobacter sp.]|nr:fibronectin-binding autotransporter adhesin [Chthoniobacter sp.]